MKYYHYFPLYPQSGIVPPEQRFDLAADRLFDELDTLRHEAFALKNRRFRAVPETCPWLERLLAKNKAAQNAICQALSKHNCIF